MRSYLRPLLAWLLWVRAVGAQLSLAFSAVALGGRTQCLADPPAFTRYATSLVECPNLCYDQLRGCCVAFNFRQDSSVCELFSEMSDNYTDVPGCNLYHVGNRIFEVVARELHVQHREAHL